MRPQMCWEYQVAALICSPINKPVAGAWREQSCQSFSVQTMLSHRDSNLSNSHAGNPAPHSLTFNTVLNYAFNKHIIINGTVKTFMVLFVRWRQVIHPTANSFHCQHCRGAMLRRKWREGASPPPKLPLSQIFPKAVWYFQVKKCLLQQTWERLSQMLK